MNAAVVTLIILGGGALGLARAKFEWAAVQLERAIKDGADASSDLPRDRRPWPNWGEFFYLTGLCCLVFAPLVYAAAVWWAVA
jgi:hypothetical protein